MENCVFCNAATLHEEDCPNKHPHQRPQSILDAPLGWRCPVCGRGLAPHVGVCPGAHCVEWTIGDDLAHIKFGPDDNFMPLETKD